MVIAVNRVSAFVQVFQAPVPQRKVKKANSSYICNVMLCYRRVNLHIGTPIFIIVGCIPALVSGRKHCVSQVWANQCRIFQSKNFVSFLAKPATRHTLENCLSIAICCESLILYLSKSRLEEQYPTTETLMPHDFFFYLPRPSIPL